MWEEMTAFCSISRRLHRQYYPYSVRIKGLPAVINWTKTYTRFQTYVANQFYPKAGDSPIILKSLARTFKSYMLNFDISISSSN